jgi:cytochrome P450
MPINLLNALGGEASSFARSPHQFPAQLALTSGGFGRFRLFHRQAVAITDLEFVRDVLIRKADVFKRSRAARVMRIALGDGLLTTDAELWQPARQWFEPSFRRASLANVVPEITKIIALELDQWERHSRYTHGEIQLVPLLEALVAKLTSRILFAVDWSDEALIGFQKLVNDALRQSGSLLRSPVALPTWWPGSIAGQLSTTGHKLDRLLARVLESSEGDALNSDIVQRFRESQTGSRCPFTSKRWLNELKTLAVAAFETSTTTLTWTLDLLARHPHVRDELMSEIDHVIGRSVPEQQSLSGLSFSQLVLMESMRLWPAVYNLVREAGQAFNLGNYSISQGTLVYVSIYGLHRNPALWHQPECFSPNRFADHSAGLPGYLPFAIGPHSCLGRHLALLQMQCIIIMVLQRFQICAVGDGPVEPTSCVTLRPRSSPVLNLVPRN